MNLRDLTDYKLVKLIFTMDEIVNKEIYYSLRREATLRNLVVSFPKEKIVITREEYGI